MKISMFLGQKPSERCLKGVQQLGAAVQSVLVVEGRCQDAAQTPVQITLARWDGMAGMGKEWQL